MWQGRFASYPMDNDHLVAAVRYVEMNPVRAGLAKTPEEYPWSSARAHLLGSDDSLVQVSAMLEIVKDWRGFLDDAMTVREMEQIRRHERTGRPVGNDQFFTSLEDALGVSVRPKKRGPK